jgi:hypothetical protein
MNKLSCTILRSIDRESLGQTHASATPLLNGRADGRAIRFCAVALAWLLALLLSHAAAADEASEHIWLVSTRCAPQCGEVSSSLGQINYWRMSAEHGWVAADEEAFLHGDDHALPTTIFVHGNRTDRDRAVEQSWCLYQQMRYQAAGQPFRLVIWSWPSDRIPGSNRSDAQVKAAYSDAEASYLAMLLGRMEGQTPVSLIGYSFGTRVITGALQIVAGGAIGGQPLSAQGAVEHKPYRVMLIAAAIDANALLPCGRAGLALSQVDKMLITRNACDRVLKWYPMMYGHGGPEALGFVGPLGCGETDKIELVDVSCSVGRTHDWAQYAMAPEICGRLAHYALEDNAN